MTFLGSADADGLEETNTRETIGLGRLKTATSFEKQDTKGILASHAVVEALYEGRIASLERLVAFYVRAPGGRSRRRRRGRQLWIVCRALAAAAAGSSG